MQAVVPLALAHGARKAPCRGRAGLMLGEGADSQA